jgi:4-diphosphocytidyl-2-C-methyl-D-erythritol kinase
MEPQDKLYRVEAPAKLNLYLEVLGKRPDGYHELETVMQTVTLYDELTFSPTPAGDIEFSCQDPAVPNDATNLVVRAAELLRKETGTPSGAQITLKKRIPVVAGLGGGSSDAASTLMTLNRLWNLDLSQARLGELAAQVGSDVPFFLVGGAALCRGRGERVSPVLGVGPRDYVLVSPRIHVSTKQVYENVPIALTTAPFGTKVFLQELTRRRRDGGPLRVFNRLQEVTLRVYPQLAKTFRTMQRVGFETVCMTGSGSTFFAVCASRKEAATLSVRLVEEGFDRVFEVSNTVNDNEAFG